MYGFVFDWIGFGLVGVVVVMFGCVFGGVFVFVVVGILLFGDVFVFVLLWMLLLLFVVGVGIVW